MTAHLLTGSKLEIADKVAKLAGDVREAIVFINESNSIVEADGNIFAEMASFTVQQPNADDARAAIYQPLEGE
jgi:hypothetical protein